MNQNNNELYHYGVLGMKWGHRRAQRRQVNIERSRAEGIRRVDDNIKSIKDKRNKVNAKLNNYEITRKKANRKLRKLDEKQQKAELDKREIKTSKYGKTSMALAADAYIRDIGIKAVTEFASKTAVRRGKDNTAKLIELVGKTARTGNIVGTGYAILDNNRRQNR